MLGVGGVGYAIFNFDGLPDRPLIKNVETTAQWSSWNFAHNDICMRRYPNPEAASYDWWFCMASKEEKPSLLVLGNSHANALYAGLSGTEGFSQHSILSIGDCDPDDQEYESADSNSHPCGGFNKAHQQKFIDAIIANSELCRNTLSWQV